MSLHTEKKAYQEEWHNSPVHFYKFQKARYLISSNEEKDMKIFSMQVKIHVI